MRIDNAFEEEEEEAANLKDFGTGIREKKS